MKSILLLVIAVVVLSGCTGIKSVSDYDTTVDFSQYKTFEYYGWHEDTTDDLNSLDKRRIENSFNEEFEKRDLQHVEKDSGGDLIVSLYLITERTSPSQQTTTRSNNSNVRVSVHVGYGGYYGYGPGWGYGPGYGGYTTTHIQEIEKNVGTLICSVYDAKKQQLVWEGAASKTIDENPEIRKKSIPYVVRAIMREYPKK